jgi:hypothetical protein
MDDLMEKYELDVELMRKKNDVLLEKFETYLDDKGLSIKTQRKHLFNVEFFINVILLRIDINTPEDGWSLIDDFLSYRYIYNCSWSSLANLKVTITSFKKFYLYLHEQNRISDEVYFEVLTIIKENKNEWIKLIKEDEAAMNQWLDEDDDD